MRVLPNFLPKEDMIMLRAWMLMRSDSFKPGRQGTGYTKLVVEDIPPLRRIWERCLGELLRDKTPQRGEVPHDCFIIRYPVGSYIPSHKDPVQASAEHHRLNIILDQPAVGGLLIVDHCEYRLLPSDAYIFRPDLEEHEVTKIEVFDRYVFTVGALL